MALRESNEAAFFGLLAQDITGLLPLVYTPTVGEACQNWSKLLPRPTGLYISIHDKVEQPAAMRMEGQELAGIFSWTV